MRWFHPFPLALSGLFTSSLLLFPSLASAEAVCCPCFAPGETTNRTCIEIDSAKLGSTTNCETLPEIENLGDGWRCNETGVDPDDPKCKKVVAGGVCVIGPTTADKAKSAVQGEAVTKQTAGPDTTQAPIPFKLNIDIPGFEGVAVSPSLVADYLVALIRYVISIVAIATTVMFIYGAFLYLIGGAITSISKGKRIMIDAIVGMLLVISSTLILRTLNPTLLTLRLLDVSPVETITVAFEDVPPIFAGSVDPPPYGIPLDCPTRATSRGKSLSQETIQKYIDYQNRSGAPAAALIGQMFVESQNAAPCAMINMFDDLKGCGLANFAGIGCTWKMTNGFCPHVAFGPAKVGGSAGPKLSPEESQKYVDKWNRRMGHDGECVKSTKGFSRQSYIASDRCGDTCIAIPSHTNLTDDRGRQLWIESVFCLRKLDTPKAFIDVHTSYVQHCLPFNKSVYKFVYCVGLSTSYASGWDYAKEIAEAIEKNCLCDPEKDADGCQRDIELENDMATGKIRKYNFWNLASDGKWDEEAYQRVVQKVWEMTDGRLTPSS